MLWAKRVAERRQVERARELWVRLFEQTLHALLDYEMRPEEARKRVAVCTEVADAALDEIEKRWPS